MRRCGAGSFAGLSDLRGGRCRGGLARQRVAVVDLLRPHRGGGAREVISSSDDLGRVALSAYTYFHIPMIVEIIALGADDELTLAHPGGRTSAALVALTLGVTALALAGHALFKRVIFGVLFWPRMVAIVALIALMPVGFKISALALSGVAGLIVVNPLLRCRRPGY
jgi:low temperature requirement protein LtrA